MTRRAFVHPRLIIEMSVGRRARKADIQREVPRGARTELAKTFQAYTDTSTLIANNKARLLMHDGQDVARAEERNLYDSCGGCIELSFRLDRVRWAAVSQGPRKDKTGHRAVSRTDNDTEQPAELGGNQVCTGLRSLNNRSSKSEF